MWLCKRLKWLVFGTVLIAGLLIPTSIALADLSAGVTITASGIVVGMPGGFLVYYISDTEVGLSWTKPAGAVNTMIRAKYGEYPHDITDGYLVYSGAGNNTSDVGMNFEEFAGTIYYKAWSQDALGIWSATAASGWLEAPTMTLIAFFLFCGIMTFIAVRTSYYILKYLAGLSFWALAMYWMSSPPSTVTKGSPVDTIVIVLLFFIGIAIMVMTWWLPKYDNGKEVGGRFRLPFQKSEEQEAREQYRPSRRERNDEHTDRINRALRGEVRRRR